MDYRKTAKEILGYVGGSKNIVSAAHCATRLRLVIADNSKADKEAIENVDGVKGVFEASGQLQIILGTGTVNKVFDEFIAIAGITASTKAEAKEAAADGSMRDALSLLDQWLAFYLGKDLKYENVLDVLGAVDTAVFSKMLSTILSGDVAVSMSLLEDLIMQG